MDIRNLLFLSFSAFLISSINCVTDEELANFDKGKNIFRCLHNCRHHHRVTLALPRGEGQGSCFGICEEAHPRK